MLRLSVMGGTHDEWRDVARRLRGATLDPAAPPEQCDAVVLVGASEEDVERFLDEGKHVLLAEPSPIDHPRLVAVNRDRYLPSRQLIRQQLDAQLGSPGLVRLVRWGAGPGDLVRDLDTLVWLVGRSPEVVYSSPTDAGVMHAHLGFTSGAMALLSHAGPDQAEGYCSLTVIASAGAAYADDAVNRQLLFTRGAARAVAANEATLGLTAMVQAFVDAVAAGTNPSPDSSRVFAVRDAVLRSRSAGRAMHLEAHP